MIRKGIDEIVRSCIIVLTKKNIKVGRENTRDILLPISEYEEKRHDNRTGVKQGEPLYNFSHCILISTNFCTFFSYIFGFYEKYNEHLFTVIV